MWHRFTKTSDEDSTSQCVDCDVIVDDLVLDDVTVECPARLCTELTNEGEPCVFVPSEEGSECAYCGRPGELVDDD